MFIDKYYTKDELNLLYELFFIYIIIDKILIEVKGNYIMYSKINNII
jgi:hypothetical protein